MIDISIIIPEIKKCGHHPSTLSLIALFFLAIAQNSPQAFVAAHNKVRASLGLPLVKWNAAVAAYASHYATVRSADCNLEHSQGDYGENLAKASWDLTAAEAVKIWADEKKFYQYRSNSRTQGEMCEHYTQVVWRDSSNISCATARCRNDDWTFVTCNYYPSGNYIGERPY